MHFISVVTAGRRPAAQIQIVPLLKKEIRSELCAPLVITEALQRPGLRPLSDV